MASRGLAKANIAAKGVASGIAGFMDFRKSFEDAVRKNKWEKERQQEEDRLKRQETFVGAGGQPENWGQYLATGNMGQATMPELPSGYQRVGGKIYQDTSKPTMWDIQKEARTTVNAIINQNTELQYQVMENPSLITDLIDKEVERLSTQYGLTAGKVKKLQPKSTNRIRVRLKETGQTGTIEEQEFDTELYDKL